MYDAVSHAMGIRKSILFTTAIACVLWASETPDIDWIIDLKGWKAWLFLGIAHFYYVISWWQWRGRAMVEPLITTAEKEQRTADGQRAQLHEALSDPEHRRGRWRLVHQMTNLAALFGGMVIVGNFLYAFEQHGPDWPWFPAIC